MKRIISLLAVATLMFVMSCEGGAETAGSGSKGGKYPVCGFVIDGNDITFYMNELITLHLMRLRLLLLGEF